MFGWLRKLIGGVSTQPPPTQPERTKTLAQPATVYEVVDRFLTHNPAPTPYSVHALIAAGAAGLAEPAELLQVCEKIQEHGYQYPLNPTLRSDLTESELLGFLVGQRHFKA